MPEKSVNESRRVARRTALIYAAAAAGWILVSDHAVGVFTGEAVPLLWGNIAKGLAFVTISASLLHWFIGRQFQALDSTEAALRETERRNELAMEAGQVGIWDWDLESNHIDWHGQHAALWGMKPEEFRGTYDEFIQRVHPDDRADLEAAVNQALREQTTYRHEFRLVRPGGSTRWILGQGGTIYNPSGKPVRMSGIVKDITEQKAAEEALREAERFAHATLDALTEQVCVLDETGTIIAINESWRRFAGENSPSAARVQIGVNYLAVCEVAPADTPGAAAFAQAIRAMLRGQCHEFGMEYPCHSPTEPRWFMGQISRFAGDGPVRLVVSHANITERKLAEEALLQAKAELEARVVERTAELTLAKEHAETANQFKSAFLSTMSHELRTPLNSICGFTGILLQELAGPLNEEQRKQLGLVSKSAAHLLNLINDVLDLARVEAGKVELKRETFDLATRLRDWAHSCEPQSQAGGLGLHLNVPAEPVRLNGDSRRVGQIVLNLLGNAIKFTREGRIEVGLKVIADPANGHPEQWVRLHVTDTGVGISPEDRERIFEPFFQVRADRNQTPRGTGLGLGISRKLAEHMGGSLTVVSKPGRGSTFTLDLPRLLPPSPDSDTKS